MNSELSEKVKELETSNEKKKKLLTKYKEDLEEAKKKLSEA